MISNPTPHRAYTRVDVETASQSKLILMLLDGAIQRAEQAKRSLSTDDIPAAHRALVRAQDILAELRAGLDMTTGDIATNLNRIYEYLGYLLITANVEKDPAPITECIAHLNILRDTWDEALQTASTERNAPPIDPHGAALMNLKG